MVTYNDTLAMFVRYDGTKEAFNNVKGDYLGKIVFIYGSKSEVTNQEGLVQAIWVSDENGGRYLDMANLSTVKEGLSHVDGLAFLKDGSTTQYDKYDLTGGKGFIFKGANGITVKLNPSTSVNVDGKPYWSIEIDGNGIISSLVGTTKNNSTPATHPDTITGAKAYADKLAADIKGTKDTGDTTDQTVAGAKDYADAAAAKVKTELIGTGNDQETVPTIGGAKKYAKNQAEAAKGAAVAQAQQYVDPLLAKKADIGDDDKILTKHLPDYILGQLMFGGFLSSATGIGANSVGTIAPTTDFGSRFPNITTIKNNDTDKKAYKGVYFIVQPSVAGTSVTFAGETFHTGDWVLSTGASWSKVDNTDAVSSVAGLTGTITASALAKMLAETNDPNELALKSEVDAKYSKPEGGIPVSHLDEDTQDAIEAAGSALQVVVSDTTTYIDANPHKVNNTIPAAKVSAKTKDIEDFSKTTDGLATTADVRKFLAAMLKVRVVS